MAGATLVSKLKRRASVLVTLNESLSKNSADGRAEVKRASTVEVVEQWRRPSLKASTSSFQERLVASFRPGKHNAARGSGGNGNSVLYNSLLCLPNELHTLVLLNLDFDDILALRLTSRTFLDIVNSCQSAIVRHYIKYECAPLELALYPPPPPSQAELRFLLNIRHRTITARKLSTQLCNFVAREILRRNTARKRRQFTSTWNRMYKKLVPLIFTLGHFFEEYRSIVITRCLANSKPNQSFQIYSGSTLWEDQLQIMDKYDPILLLGCYHMYGFMLQAFERKLRPPSYATPLKRFIRGWTAKPATTHQIEILLILGGMDQIQSVLSHRTYNERRKALDAFIKGLNPNESTKWKENWKKLGVLRSDAEFEKMKTARIGVPALHLIWVPNALNLLLQKEVIEHVDFGGDSSVRSTRDFVSDLVGYDILRHAGPPPAPLALDSDDDDDDDIDSSASDDDDDDPDDSDTDPGSEFDASDEGDDADYD